jgi:hypothetical protein
MGAAYRPNLTHTKNHDSSSYRDDFVSQFSQYGSMLELFLQSPTNTPQHTKNKTKQKEKNTHPTKTMATATATAINWPTRYTPGQTSNFVSNETIASNLTATQLWPLLSNPTNWPTYYWNCAEITPPPNNTLTLNAEFKFSTFGFPPLPCTVAESIAPSKGVAGRLAWEAITGSGSEKIYVYHAWIVEDLPGNRVRILTQESQIGGIFEDFKKRKPNPMLNGHQDWLDGLVHAARGEKSEEPGAWSEDYRR